MNSYVVWMIRTIGVVEYTGGDWVDDDCELLSTRTRWLIGFSAEFDVKVANGSVLIYKHSDPKHRVYKG